MSPRPKYNEEATIHHILINLELNNIEYVAAMFRRSLCKTVIKMTPKNM